MIIYSELTGQKYQTVDECEKAEKEFKLKKEAEEAEKEKKNKEIKDAYKEAIAAVNKYFKLVGYEVEVTELSPRTLFNFWRDFF